MQVTHSSAVSGCEEMPGANGEARHPPAPLFPVSKQFRIYYQSQKLSMSAPLLQKMYYTRSIIFHLTLCEYDQLII